MLESDFTRCGITVFTPQEVRDTGADISAVKTGLMVSLQVFRMDSRINRPVGILPGGMTSGTHRAPEHPRGEAADIAFHLGQTPPISCVVGAALAAGFRGIGVYHNQFAYSFHLDIGQTYRFWSAWKLHGETAWRYESLFVDPAERTTR